MLSCDVISWDDNTPLFYLSWKLHSLQKSLDFRAHPFNGHRTGFSPIKIIKSKRHIKTGILVIVCTTVPVFCVLYYVFCILYSVFCVLCSVFRSLYFVFCILSCMLRRGEVWWAVQSKFTSSRSPPPPPPLIQTHLQHNGGGRGGGGLYLLLPIQPFVQNNLEINRDMKSAKDTLRYIKEMFKKPTFLPFIGICPHLSVPRLMLSEYPQFCRLS